jgi:transposase
LTGKNAAQMEQWIDEALDKARAGTLESVTKAEDNHEPVTIAEGYEFERLQNGTSPLQPPRQWNERVLVIRSFAHAKQQAVGLEKRLAHAEQKIAALTPARGRGKRQIGEEAELLEAIEQVLKTHRVGGLMSISYEKQTERHTQYVGRGRGAAHREKQPIENVRYQITSIQRQQQKIAELQQRFGWKAFVTDVAKARMSLPEALLCYRHEYRVERIFNRLKSRLNIAPVFVKRDDQVQGLTHWLMLGVRGLTLIEFVVRRSLQNDQTALADLHPENKNKITDKPPLRANPQSLFRSVSDHYQTQGRTGDLALAGTPVIRSTGYPPTPGVSA